MRVTRIGPQHPLGAPERRVRNPAFTVNGVNHEASADLTGQANHLGVTIEADIIKQKQPVSNGGYRALNTGHSSYGKFDERIYTERNDGGALMGHVRDRRCP